MLRLFALALAALVSPAFANGVITEFPGTGLIFKEAADIAIEREDLFLSIEKVMVHYDYRSDATGTQTVTIGFPMPAVPIDGSPSDPSSWPEFEGSDILNYMQFSASVDGKPVTTTLHQFAWFDGKDITAELAAAGIPAYLPVEGAAPLLASVAKRTLDDLVKRGIVYVSEGGEYATANWLYQTVYEWQQDFAPGMTKVDIAYQPLTGFPSDIGDYYEEDPDGTYCVDDALRAAIASHEEKGAYEVATLGYITTTATYWKGPIGEFNLTIAKDQPDPEYSQFASETAFCGKRESTETATGYTWTAQDYVPEKDVSVVWYSFCDYSE